MKIIIAGGRTLNDYELLKSKVTELTKNILVTEIVSGGANGADKLGEMYAKEHNIPIKQFLPDWDGLGKKAGLVRNTQMAGYADALIAFWDGDSKGTHHMIKEARKNNLHVRVITYVKPVYEKPMQYKFINPNIE